MLLEVNPLINLIIGEASAIKQVAVAKAEALQKVGQSLTNSGRDAAALSVAEQYVKAFGELAKTNNTLILPKDAGDVSSFVAQVSFSSGSFLIDVF